MKTYCVEVKRGGVGEEDFTEHFYWDGKPTRDDVLKIIEEWDCGYDDKYCSFTFYEV